MTVTPKRNLSPASEPWGRTVDRRLDQIEKTAAQTQQNTSNAQSAINSTVTKLSEQVGAIDELTQRLSLQQAELEAQQAELEAQQSQLASQVAQVNALVNTQLVPNTAHKTSKDFGLLVGLSNPRFTELARVSIPAPAGYSRALVFASGTLSARNNASGGDNIYLDVAINGALVGYPAYDTVETGYSGSISRSATALLTVTGGMVHVTAEAGTGLFPWPASPGFNAIDLSAMIIFLR